MDKNIVLAVIFGAAAVVGAMETVYQIVNGDGCSRPWIKTSKIMGTACCERE